MSGRMQDRVEAALRQFAERPALHDLQGAVLRFDELDHWSKTVSEVIPDGLPEGSRIALCLPKGFAAVAAIFGILRSECAYLPLDYDAPLSRNAFILEDARVSGLLTLPERSAAICAVLPGAVAQTIELGGQLYHLVRFAWAGQAAFTVPEDLAYILYTSGSTGQPKGVMITHDNALCFIDWSADQFGVSPDDVVSSIAPFHFDLSIFDLYAALFRGASIVLIDAASARNPMLLAEVMERFGISIWYATPTTLKLMLRFGRMERYTHARLRVVLFAGEVFPVEPLHVLMARWPQASFHNLYGPTETNVCTWYSLPVTPDPERTEPYPIGHTCPYDQAVLLQGDEVLEARPGAEGELLIGGRSVMAGYLNQPDRNARAFYHWNGKTYYHTGDLVRVDPEGALIYLSRKDRMVKRNGYRIELGEIEAALHRHPDITEAGAIAQATPTGDMRILGFYSTAHGGSIDTLPLQEFLSGQIPAYMLPDQCLHLTELPKTSTHKVNYPALSQAV